MLHFPIFIHEHIVFHHIHHLSFSLPFPQIPQTGSLLPSCPSFFERVISVCLRQLYREFHHDISMCICIMSKLVHPLHFSLFYLSPLLMVVSTGLKILGSFLYRKYIYYIHLICFHLLPSFCH
jgi:hypothetical protein